MTSCGATDRNTYQENQIQELYVKEMTDGTLVLTVIPIANFSNAHPAVDEATEYCIDNEKALNSFYGFDSSMGFVPASHRLP